MTYGLIPSVVSTDILRKSKLKPWFETLQEYLAITSILISIYMEYNIKSDGLLHCISANHSVEFEVPTASYANSYCSHQLFEWHEKNLGLICLFFSIGIYICYSWWEIVPSVKESFLLLRECDTILKSLSGTPASFLSFAQDYFSIHPIQSSMSKDESTKLVDVCHRMWCGQSKSKLNLFRLYLLRNGIVVVLLIASVSSLGIFPLREIYRMQNPSICLLEIMGHGHVECFIAFKNDIFPLTLIFLAIQSLLLLINIINSYGFRRWNNDISGMTKNDWVTENLESSDYEQMSYRECCNRFVMKFSRHSTPFSRKTTSLMLFSNVISRDHITTNRNVFQSFCEKLEKDETLGETQFQKDELITLACVGIKALGEQIRKGHHFDDFLKLHRLAFLRLESSIYEIDCGCSDLFGKRLPASPNEMSLMRHALQHSRDFTDVRVRVHLLLSSLNEDGRFQSCVLINDSHENEVKLSPKEYLEQQRKSDDVNMSGIAKQILAEYDRALGKLESVQSSIFEARQ